MSEPERVGDPGDPGSPGDPGGLRRLPFDAHPIRTSRLLLRPLTAADARDVAAYQGLPDVVRYLPWPVRNPAESREHTLTRAGYTRLADDGDGLILGAELVQADGTAGPVIGDLSVFLSSREHAQVSLGWVFHPDWHGRGLASEAARAVLDLAFFELGAHRAFAELDPRNAASAALCLRLGMRMEAHLVESEFFKGEWSDLQVFAILARDWTAARP
jgi:RimJ/RimL family protein N-acetyltransferase